MKRTRRINLDRMKKQPVQAMHFAVKPLAFMVTVFTLSACSNNDMEAKVYKDISQCIQDHPDMAEQCTTAYEDAQRIARESGPKYRSQSECETDFGVNNCNAYQSGNNNWFIPLVGGYVLAEVIDEIGDAMERKHKRYYHSSPVFTSYAYGSPMYGQWTSVSGRTYGKAQYGKVKVGKDVFKPQPKVTRTISRGGFGSKVAAKSNWGGSSRSSGSRGWGG